MGAGSRLVETCIVRGSFRSLHHGDSVPGKTCCAGGMSIFALLFYRSMFGAVFTLPFALYFESGKWKEVNTKTVGWLFLNALSGYSLPMAFYYYGLRNTAASYAVIFSSITPLVTFVLSILIGIEQLNIKSKSGSAKVLGALFCFTGALLISLYTGKELHRGRLVISVSPKGSNAASGENHLRGTLLMLSFGLSYATWYPIQVKVLKVCPWKHWSSVLTCILGGVQPLVVGITITRDKSAWQMKWNIQLLTIIYSAALGTAVKYWLNLYAVEKKGPVFPPMFSVLSTVFTIILGILLLGESLTLGR
ncbi:unnamed protein product [Triticum turgidum subsp. durum]|uniref:WAT1-related protein n=2 Tax=Triticum TaxID=4564 RepID=A0A9R1BYW4_TRITD|nr:unnamed protein product [Triticum turgidum subsp. durum]